MQSKAATVEAYLAELPPDRRAAIQTVREVILKNLDKDYEEGMQYGMIGYFVPHRIFPQGYHCDPSKPLNFAALASQKNGMSLYMMCEYTSCNDQPDSWLRREWAKTGKKMDMGKSCIRFKKVEDLPLDLIGEAIRRVPVQAYLKQYRAAMALNEERKAAAATSKSKPAKAARAASPAKAAKAPKASAAAKRLKKSAKKAPSKRK